MAYGDVSCLTSFEGQFVVYGDSQVFWNTNFSIESWSTSASLGAR